MICCNRSFLLMAILPLFAVTFANSAVPIRTVALTGQQAPGAPDDVRFGGFFTPMFGPVILIDDAGHVSFRAHLLQGFGGVVVANDTGIWSEGSGDLTLIAREGDAAPGAPAGAIFADLASTTNWPVMGATGHMAFSALLTSGPGGVNGTNDSGIWSEGSGALTLLAREGNTAPGAGGGLFGAFDYTSPQINASGKTAFRTYLQHGPGGVNAANDVGMWSEGFGPMTLVARDGFLAPGTLNIFDGRFGDPSINAAGHIAFYAYLDSGVSNDSGVWTEAPGPMRLLARSGRYAPGAGGPLFRYLNRPTINNSGLCAFAAELDTSYPGVTIDNRRGIWAEYRTRQDLPPDLFLVVRQGDPAPDAPAGANFAYIDNPISDNFNRVAFHSYLQFSPGIVDATNNEGLWSNQTGVVRMIVRKGDDAPGVPAGAKFSSLDQHGINGVGRVVFMGRLTGTVTPGVDDTGIWAQDATGAVFLVARRGDVVEVAPGDSRKISDLWTLPGSNDGSRRAVNDVDQIAYWASFTDGSQGIFVTVGPDADSDGINDAFDECPNDPGKSAPGVCGCGIADADADADGTPDCNDGCPNDPAKTAPGICGCGLPDTDSDGDGILDCNDNCPNIPNGDQTDSDANGIGDACETIGAAQAAAPGCGTCGSGMPLMLAFAVPLLMAGKRHSFRGHVRQSVLNGSCTAEPRRSVAQCGAERARANAEHTETRLPHGLKSLMSLVPGQRT